MEQISIYLTSIILGIMLFFSFVVAPVTFTALDEENARKFIRKIFPYYYTINLTISVLVLILFIIKELQEDCCNLIHHRGFDLLLHQDGLQI